MASGGQVVTAALRKNERMSDYHGFVLGDSVSFDLKVGGGFLIGV
jgi:hypothetical protein